jgi:response regulator of citrate/malate metabolism
VLLYAYREFEARVGKLATSPGAKSQMVRSAIEAFVPGYTFSISELGRLCPTVSRETVRRVLRQLREKDQVECLGTGRDARWKKI